MPRMSISVTFEPRHAHDCL